MDSLAQFFPQLCRKISLVAEMLDVDKQKQIEHLREMNNKDEYEIQLTQKYCEQIKSAIKTSAIDIIGQDQQKKRINRKWDPEIEKLSIEQKDLRLQINNKKEIQKTRELKYQRNNIIRYRTNI